MLEIRYKTSQKKDEFKKVENVLAIQPLLAGSELVRVKETDPELERYEVVSIEPALYYGIFKAVNTTGNVEAIGYLDTNVGGAIMWEEVNGNFLLVNYPAYKQTCQQIEREPVDFATFLEQCTISGPDFTTQIGRSQVSLPNAVDGRTWPAGRISPPTAFTFTCILN